MIGFQDLVLKQNIKVYELAKELRCSPTNIYDWFNNNRVPKSRLKVLVGKFQVEEDYLNKVVNDINTYKPKPIGFSNEYKVNGKTTYIYIVNRKLQRFEVLIDTEDLQKLIDLNYNWFARWDRKTKQYYVSASYINKNNKRSIISLHNVIMNAYDGLIVDHINYKGVDNRKENLRIAANDDNSKHKHGKNKNNKSGYRNVSRRGKWWVVQIQIEGKNTTLKKFPLDQLEEAGKFAEKMRNKYYGEYAGES